MPKNKCEEIMRDTILYGKYKVHDCEHMGDLIDAESYLLRLGLEPTEKYWNRIDGGEAYIEFSCPSSKIASVYPKIRLSAVFEEDISPYLPKGEGFDMGGKFKIVDQTEYRRLYGEHNQDLSKGFERRIPLHVNFYGFANFDPNIVIENVLKAFPDPGQLTPVCCSKDPSADDNSYSYLFLAPVTQITDSVMNRIGDNLFRTKSLFKELGVNGFCGCYHALRDIRRSYADFQESVKRLVPLSKGQKGGERKGRGR